jgi:threonine aldolase
MTESPRTPPIDLRSDTVTRPTAAMRRAMAEAEVGDDERDGDPTMERLQGRVAELLGKEAALFFPSGVMANQAAVWLHTRPGTEILLDADAHIIHWEAAGAAALAGVQARTVSASSAPVMRADDVRRTLRPRSKFAPAASLLCLENTHNGAGGHVTPLAELRALRDVAREHGLPVHMDGARLWNAAAASDTTTLADFAACADTVMVAFSKGLGAPVGAALAGTRAAVEELWVVRKRLGGALRQSGILAAAALHGLDHHLPRLGEDHANARTIARLVDGAGGARVVPPDTNIVMIDLPDGVAPTPIVQRAAESGVRVSTWSPTRLRAVTHLDVTADQARRAGEVLADALSAR